MNLLEINIDRIKQWLTLSPKRFCINDWDRPSVSTGTDGFHWFNVPFSDSILPILNSIPGLENLELRENQYGRYYTSVTDEQKRLIEEYIINNRSIVYLRDFLDCSIALGFNMNPYDGNHTELGDLEYQTKYRHDKSAETKLIDNVIKVIDKIPLYQSADVVCCIPSKSKIMLSFAKVISKAYGIPDITHLIDWANTVEQDTKNCDSSEEKLQICIDRDIKISKDLNLEGKTILLIDDLYQSGINMQFTALKLKEAGCTSILGLCLVKALKNK